MTARPSRSWADSGRWPAVGGGGHQVVQAAEQEEQIRLVTRPQFAVRGAVDLVADKGAGYSDIEMALLAEGGLLTDTTTIATTVHELQLVDHELPEEDHDFRVDLIVTAERLVWCQSPKRPAGLDWENLTPDQISAIPVLQRKYSSRRN